MLWMLLSRANALAACPSGDCIHSESAFALTNPERWPIAYAPHTREPVAGIAIANDPMMATIILRRSSGLPNTLPASTARFPFHAMSLQQTQQGSLALPVHLHAQRIRVLIYGPLGVHGFDLDRKSVV